MADGGHEAAAGGRPNREASEGPANSEHTVIGRPLEAGHRPRVLDGVAGGAERGGGDGEVGHGVIEGQGRKFLLGTQRNA